MSLRFRVNLSRMLGRHVWPAAGADLKGAPGEGGHCPCRPESVSWLTCPAATGSCTCATSRSARSTSPNPQPTAAVRYSLVSQRRAFRSPTSWTKQVAFGLPLHSRRLLTEHAAISRSVGPTRCCSPWGWRPGPPGTVGGTQMHLIASQPYELAEDDAPLGCRT